MATKKTETSTENQIEFLELKLGLVEAKYWDPMITVDGAQFNGATDAQVLGLRDEIQKRIDNDKSDDFISEIVEVQRILKAKPLKRDKNGEIEMHPQAGVPQVIDHDVSDLRPINRILWAIEDALKGHPAAEVKSITIKFGLIADTKKPKYSDAEYLATLVGYDTEKVRGISEAWPIFRDKFVPEEWSEDKKASTDGCLLTDSKKIQAKIK